jgi:small subunit ribosomal protein S8e
MTRWHTRPSRKPTGGKLRDNEKRKSRHKGSKFLDTRIGKRNLKISRARGGADKKKILSAEFVNVSDPGTKGFKKAKIISVEANQANPHYIRRNIITRGAVVKTEIGSVRITSRPGQTGSLNGVLLEEKKPV